MAQLLSSKNLFLSSRPLTVGVISDPVILEEVLAMAPIDRVACCDVVELRLDLLQLPGDELAAKAPALGLPLLLTARHPAEGGQGTADAAGRAALIEPLLPLAIAIDLEIRSIPEMSGLIAEAKARGVSVLGSFHDFQATPADSVLDGVVAYGEQAGLGAVKLATYLNSSADLQRLMALLARPHRLPLSVMGMGPLGRVSRLTLAKLGSLLNYGFLGEANAPGQWPAPHLKELLAQL